MPPPIIGPQLESIRRRIPPLAASWDDLVITGEEGVGKSLVASHVRSAGDGECRPGFTINCSTASERDQCLTLFGTEYVGLNTTRRSVLELWATVVIKHIDRARLKVQESLGEALLGRVVKRPGSLFAGRMRARVILTLRESPEILAKHSLIAPALAGAIRHSATIQIPPLRDRNEDCLAIACHVLGSGVSPRLRRTLLGYSWPRNVAELKAYLALSRPLPLTGSIPTDCCRELSRMFLRIEEGGEISLPAETDSIQTYLVRFALRQAGHDCDRAAQMLGITVRCLQRRMSRLRDPV